MPEQYENVVVIVRVPKPRFAPKWLVRRKMRESIPLYSKLDGLEFKAFTFERGSGDFGGIYTWRDRAAAESWFTDAWFARVRRERGSDAYVRMFDVVQSLDNVPGGTASTSRGAFVATLVSVPALNGMSRDQVLEAFAAETSDDRPVAGLLRKHYAISQEGAIGEISIWDSAASARAQLGDSWRRSVSENFGSAPVVEWFDAPILLANTK